MPGVPSRAGVAGAGADGRSRQGSAPVLATALVLAAACRIGDPTPGPAFVAWAAYPDTVVAGEPFSFEFAGPVAPDACGRLDTAMVAVRDTVLELSARRSTFQTMCPRERVSFYEARAMVIGRPGTYIVRTVEGLELGRLHVVEEGRFSAMRTRGYGTVRRGGGCLLFGPGWVGNQRPFALADPPEVVTAEAGTDRLLRVDGRLVGFTVCGAFGSRPTIRVDSARATERWAADWYRDGERGDERRREDGTRDDESDTERDGER